MADYMATMYQQQIQQQMRMQMQMCDPLYECIDNEDFKKGVALGSTPQMKANPLAQSLRGYMYAMLKQVPEAMECTRAAMAMYPTDEGALSAIQHTLRTCNKEDELGPYYESLASKYPHAAGQFLTMLFTFYTRQGDGKKMQNTAQKLYKLTNDRKYQFWSVASMLQQDGLPPMMMTIAEKTIMKLFYPPSGSASSSSSSSSTGAAADAEAECQPGAEEIELYLEILLKQGKVREALAALDSLYGRVTGLGKGIKDETAYKGNTSVVKMHEMRYRSLRVDLCTKLQLLADSSGGTGSGAETASEHDLVAMIKNEHETLLLTYPDQWSSHKQLAYIAVTGKLEEQQQQGKVGAGDQAGVVARQETLHRMMVKDQHLRGAYLAEILLLSLWIQGAGGDGLLPDGWKASSPPIDFPSSSAPSGGKGDPIFSFVCLLARYIDRFQSKQCCFGDVKDKIDFVVERGGARGATLLTDLVTWTSARALEIEENTKSLVQDSPAKKSDEKEHPAREECIKLVCSLAKMGQVACYIRHSLGLSDDTTGDNGDTNNDADGGATDLARMQLHLQSKAFCVGGIGGEREVQPADEVLLLCSTWRRRKASVAASTGNNAVGGSGCAGWATMLAAGVSASPFSHAFKLDMLQPLRALNAGQHAIVLFDDLGVKNVQVDSMSYIILPSLLESGMFHAAWRQNCQVCNFHSKAGKDTGEMIGKSFEHSNYAKGLEMKRFHAMCKSSIQLALSKAEMPFLELIQKRDYDDVEMAAQFLEECVGGDLDSKEGGKGGLFTQPYLDDAALAALSNNCDYGIVVQCDATLAEEARHASLRRSQTEARIREAQVLLRLLSATLNAEPRTAAGYLQDLRDCLGKRGVPVLPESEKQAISGASVGAAGDNTATEKASSSLLAVIDAMVGAIVVDPKAEQELKCMHAAQAIDAGGRRYEMCLYTAVIDCFLFSNACAATLEIILALDPTASSGKADVVASGQEKVKEVIAISQQLAISLQALETALLGDASVFATMGEKEVKVVDPEAIRRFAAFTRTLGRWMPLMLKAGLKSFPEVGSSMLGCGGGVGDDDKKGVYSELFSQVGSSIRASAMRAESLLQKVKACLVEMESTSKNFHRLRPYPLFEAVKQQQGKEETGKSASASNEALALLEKCRQSTSKDVLESHASSCSRMSQCNDDAIAILKSD